MERYRERLKYAKSLLWESYRNLYGENSKGNFEELLLIMEDAYKSRPKEFIKDDLDRKSDWYMSQSMAAVMLYIDLFADNLRTMKEKVPYLHELGITYVHMLPFLKSRKGPNDGGYAVSDYKQIDDRFGSLEDFKELIREFRKYGIHCCADFVMNHTAKEHVWAKKAAAGEKKYQDYYLMYADREIPNTFEKTVPEVLPLVSPQNFTYYSEFKRWVFTSFNEYQWDLNYANPELFNAITENLLFLANLGVDIIRLDAIPFIWKELHTSCRNLPGAHKIVALLHRIVKIVCPAVILKGEAIVEPAEIVKYFGNDEEIECDIMYNASGMVQLWSALATQDVRMLVRTASKRYQIPKHGTWINYVRCHDDIGWGFDQDIYWVLGWDPEAHKQFLISFYKGTFPGSFSIGELYEFNPITMDARISGTTASLCGCERALILHDEKEFELALRRILLLYGMIIMQDGIPMIYSGDEIAQMNDWSYQNDKDKKQDSRWIHRGRFVWENVGLCEKTYQNRIFCSIKRMLAVRREHTIFRSDTSVKYYETVNQHVLKMTRTSRGEQLIVFANFSENRQIIPSWIGEDECGTYEELLRGKDYTLGYDGMLAPYEQIWLLRK